MTTGNKAALCALALTMLVAQALQVHPARAEDPSNGPAMTLAMVPAPLGKVVAPLAEPALLCGNVWVQTDYVLPENCYRACLRRGRSLLECRTKWVPLCRACWSQLLACASSPAIPPPARC